MIWQTRVTVKTGSATLTYAEIGDIVVTGSGTLTLPAASPGVWYRISNASAGVVTVGALNLGPGAQGLCVAGTIWYYSSGGNSQPPSHGDLDGLDDDDHEQYLNETRHNNFDHTGITGCGSEYTLPQATGSYLAGLKLRSKTSGETQEVKIDPVTGKLYTAPPAASAKWITGRRYGGADTGQG